MALKVGDDVVSLIDNGLIKEGEKGTVFKFDRWIGEKYPYVVYTDDGRSEAYSRHELGKVLR